MAAKTEIRKNKNVLVIICDELSTVTAFNRKAMHQEMFTEVSSEQVKATFNDATTFENVCEQLTKPK